jgi:hypothetical protein
MIADTDKAEEDRPTVQSVRALIEKGLADVVGRII